MKKKQRVFFYSCLSAMKLLLLFAILKKKINLKIGENLLSIYWEIRRNDGQSMMCLFWENGEPKSVVFFTKLINFPRTGSTAQVNAAAVDFSTPSADAFSFSSRCNILCAKLSLYNARKCISRHLKVSCFRISQTLHYKFILRGRGCTVHTNPHLWTLSA